MSMDERHKGTLTYIGEYDEEKAMNWWNGHHSRAFDEWDYLHDNKLHKFGNKLYKLEDEEINYDDPYFSEMREVEPGKYEYHMMFYNGGTCLGKMLDDELSKLNK